MGLCLRGLGFLLQASPHGTDIGTQGIVKKRLLAETLVVRESM